MNLPYCVYRARPDSFLFISGSPPL